MWHYTFSNEDRTQDLGIVTFLKGCKTTAALLNKNVDSIYKFSSSKNGYSILGNYKNSDAQIDCEYTFNVEGLITLRNEKMTDLNSVEATTDKTTYKYE